MKKKVTVIVALLTLVGAAALPFLRPQPPRLWVLSVGQGEAVLYRDPAGDYLLFDGGPDETVLSELGRTLPPWQRVIHTVALSHYHSDHLRGLVAVLNRYVVERVWESGAHATGNDVDRWRELVTAQALPVENLVAGNIRTLGKTHIQVMHPLQSAVGQRFRDAHDATLVLQLTVPGQRILLTGDLDEGHERNIMSWCKPPDCTLASSVFQVPHHGSAYGLSPPFLKAVRPKIAFICVGQDNRFNHPRPEILQKLEAARVPYHRTDTGGGLVISLYPDRLEYQKTQSAPR